MSQYTRKTRYKAKSKKRAYNCIYFLFLFVLLGVLLFEMYTLFFQAQLVDKVEPQTSSSIEPPKKEAITKEQFDQPVEPTNSTAKNMDELLTKANFIGTASIIKNGTVLLQKGYGYANFEKKILNAYNSLFQIGSVQKTMTAVLIMEQIKAGNLSLEDTLNTFYPTVPQSQTITLRQLLTMTSGLHPTEGASVLMTDDELLQFVANHVKVENQGTFQYASINYTFLAGILAKLTGSSYNQLFRQNIQAKLYLEQTFFYPDFLKQATATSAYQKIGAQEYAQLIQETPLQSFQEIGTGNVATSNADLYWFFRSFAQGQLIPADLMETLWIPSESGNYAGGLYNYSTYYSGHGVKSGFETVLYLSKDGENAVILSSNEYPENSSYQKLGKELFNQLHSD